MIWLVVDGRQPGYSEGVSEHELARLMIDLECDQAINLDGGGSSILLLGNSVGQLRAANRPSDRTGHRPVPVALCLIPPE
jgi:exopolysaccharide biosynthesis protein